jgi:hypothetical protein
MNMTLMTNMNVKAKENPGLQISGKGGDVN